MNPTRWHLVGDIGGTNARFGYCTGERSYEHIATYRVVDYPDFSDVLNHLMADVEGMGVATEAPERVCLAVAAIPHMEEISFTNSPWRFTRDTVHDRTGAQVVAIINDFAATARAVPQLVPEDLIQIGGGEPMQGAPKVAIGPGTGMGVAAVLNSHEDHPIVVPGEGGHVDFAPVTEVQGAILKYLQSRFGRVSIERVCCGDGIVNIYQALAAYREQEAVHLLPAQIGEAAQQGEPLAHEAMGIFFSILGASAGNFALTYGAFGGVYVCGGIAPRYIDLLRSSNFRARFLAKGRFADYLASIPTYVVMHEGIGLLGAALALRDEL